MALKEGIAVFSEDFASASDETTSDTSATVLRFRHPAFYMGNRYLSTDSRVTAMAVARKRLLAVTNGGLAVLRSEKTTFEEKVGRTYLSLQTLITFTCVTHTVVVVVEHVHENRGNTA